MLILGKKAPWYIYDYSTTYLGLMWAIKVSHIVRLEMLSHFVMECILPSLLGK